ncbi:MAG: hypothetical protein ABIR50_10845 [Ginsengibacter sp.]
MHIKIPRIVWHTNMGCPPLAIPPPLTFNAAMRHFEIHSCILAYKQASEKCVP